MEINSSKDQRAFPLCTWQAAMDKRQNKKKYNSLKPSKEQNNYTEDGRKKNEPEVLQGSIDGQKTRPSGKSRSEVTAMNEERSRAWKKVNRRKIWKFHGFQGWGTAWHSRTSKGFYNIGGSKMEATPSERNSYCMYGGWDREKGGILLITNALQPENTPQWPAFLPNSIPQNRLHSSSLLAIQAWPAWTPRRPSRVVAAKTTTTVMMYMDMKWAAAVAVFIAKEGCFWVLFLQRVWSGSSMR